MNPSSAVVTRHLGAERRVWRGSFQRADETDTAYETGAVVPAGPWQQLSPKSAEMLLATYSVHLRNWSGTMISTPPGEVPGRVIDALSDGRYLGIAFKLGGVTTTSVDTSTGLRVGMHVDSWEGAPLRERRHSRGRIAMNLGPGRRYFVLAAITLKELAQVGTPWDPNSAPGVNAVRDALLSSGAPCLRIEMLPGDAYLASTESIVHDGSAFDIAEPTRTAHWLGHWHAPPDVGAKPKS